MNIKLETDILHDLASAPDLSTTFDIFERIKVSFKNGKLDENEFEWLCKKVQRSIDFSVKMLT